MRLSRVDAARQRAVIFLRAEAGATPRASSSTFSLSSSDSTRTAGILGGDEPSAHGGIRHGAAIVGAQPLRDLISLVDCSIFRHDRVHDQGLADGAGHT